MLAQLQLGSPRTSVRLAAAEELAKGGSQEASLLLRKALLREKDRGVHEALSLALARVDLQSPDANTRISAVEIIERSGNNMFLVDLRRMMQATGGDSDPKVRAAAKRAVDAVQGREGMISMVGNLVYGFSLASVLLFAALGLAVTFGLLGVINMAHGEMLMLGAYATYSVQSFFQAYAPGALRFYLVAAIPVAFVVTVLVGVLLERTVIRHLYGRPLETLLATWGISLIMQQCFRMVFGANNVQVNSPSWLQGHFSLSDVLFGYNRVFVIAFAVVIVIGTWLLLTKTPLGLLIRAVMQNRQMAACMGVRTDRVNMMTFAFGSGLAGLAGAFLSQIGNVGPSMGQDHIVNAFMTVVVGGVGSIVGTVYSAIGVGTGDQVLQQVTGSPVAGKIVMLVLIILFLQWKPGGLFAIRSRSLD